MIENKVYEALIDSGDSILFNASEIIKEEMLTHFLIENNIINTDEKVLKINTTNYPNTTTTIQYEKT